MKPINILVILCIILNPGLKVAKAQEPQKISYQKVTGITSLLVSNPDTAELAALSMKSGITKVQLNLPPKKKIHPYISDRRKFYETGLYYFGTIAAIFSVSSKTGTPIRFPSNTTNYLGYPTSAPPITNQPNYNPSMSNYYLRYPDNIPSKTESYRDNRRASKKK